MTASEISQPDEINLKLLDLLIDDVALQGVNFLLLFFSLSVGL